VDQDEYLRRLESTPEDDPHPPAGECCYWWHTREERISSEVDELEWELDGRPKSDGPPPF
jgi:hypothetical protein